MDSLLLLVIEGVRVVVGVADSVGERDTDVEDVTDDDALVETVDVPECDALGESEMVGDQLSVGERDAVHDGDTDKLYESECDTDAVVVRLEVVVQDREIVFDGLAVNVTDCDTESEWDRVIDTETVVDDEGDIDMESV